MLDVELCLSDSHIDHISSETFLLFFFYIDSRDSVQQSLEMNHEDILWYRSDASKHSWSCVLFKHIALFYGMQNQINDGC